MLTEVLKVPHQVLYHPACICTPRAAPFPTALLTPIISPCPHATRLLFCGTGGSSRSRRHFRCHQAACWAIHRGMACFEAPLAAAPTQQAVVATTATITAVATMTAVAMSNTGCSKCMRCSIRSRLHPRPGPLLSRAAGLAPLLGVVARLISDTCVATAMFISSLSSSLLWTCTRE